MYIFFRFAWVYSSIFVTFVANIPTRRTMNKWIRRKRNSWGYGVQSPSDFYFVQHVLREQSPYYGYEVLDELAENYATRLPSYPSATNRLLFRLADYVHAEQVIEVGAGLSTFAMVTGHPFAHYTAITGNETCHDTMQPLLKAYPQIILKKGDEMALFRQFIDEQQTIGMLHVAHTEYYREIVEAALPHITDHTSIIIEDIQVSKEKQAWWKSLQESPLTGITYDLGNIGLIFFNRSRSKDTYWINLRKRV